MDRFELTWSERDIMHYGLLCLPPKHGSNLIHTSGVAHLVSDAIDSLILLGLHEVSPLSGSIRTNGRRFISYDVGTHDLSDRFSRIGPTAAICSFFATNCDKFSDQDLIAGA